jgi:uncharacterized ParB-like nuclease family protein
VEQQDEEPSEEKRMSTDSDQRGCEFALDHYARSVIIDLPVDSLHEPKDLYPRAQLNPDVVERYKDVEDLPPILVSRSDDADLDRIVVDGMHRLQAAEAKGQKTIPCHLVTVKDRTEILAKAARAIAPMECPSPPRSGSRWPSGSAMRGWPVSR